MGRYAIRQLLLRIPLLIGITLLVFGIVHLTPGSPVDEYRFNQDVKPEDLASLKRTLGIDKPLPQQYVGWVSQLAKGDFGISLKNYRPVRQVIFDRLPNTLLLSGTALLLAIAVGVTLGVYSALNRNSPIDYLATAGVTLADSLPAFWVGLILILVFAVRFHDAGLPSLPSGGVQALPRGGDALDRLRHLILPAFTLSLLQMPVFIRYTRGQMLEVLGQDYVRTARAMGMPERRVTWYAFRNTMLPLITLIGLAIPSLFAGSAIIERVFSWPGVGNLIVQSAIDRDYTISMGVVVFIAFITLLSSFLTDLLYGVADPRVQLS